MARSYSWTVQMRALPALHAVLWDGTPQCLENSHLCLIWGPDHLGGFQNFRECSEALESDQPGFESLLRHLLVVWPKAKNLASS